MRSFLFVLGLVVVVLFVGGCAEFQKKVIASPDIVAIAPPADIGFSAPPNAVEEVSSAGIVIVDDAKGIRASQAEKEAAAGRKIVYTATLSLRVAGMEAARKAIDEIIKRHKGLIVESTLEEIKFRVRPELFEGVLGELSGLGEVVSREIKTEDVTAAYRDLALRQEVAEASRKRLMEILGKTGAIKDVLEVERDIRRLTEEIEGMKGQLRLLQDQVDLSTITVHLQEKVVEKMPPRHREGSLFTWINEVGLDNALEPVPPYAPLKGDRSLLRLIRGPQFRLGGTGDEPLPAGFVPLIHTREELAGTTPEDYRLRVRWFNLRQRSNLEFWGKALDEELRSYRGYTVRAREEFKVNQETVQAMVLRCQGTLANEPWAYDIWLVQSGKNPRNLYVIEYARKQKDAEAKLKVIEEAVRSIRVR